MEAIIYNTQAQADALQTRLHLMLNNKGRAASYIANSYTTTITHPTDGRVAVPIDKRFKPWWNEVQKELTPTELNNIEILTNDWFPTEEL